MRKEMLGELKTTIYRVICGTLLIGMCGCTAQTVPEAAQTDSGATGQVRIGCLESEDYYFYTEELDSAADELTRQGWIRGDVTDPDERSESPSAVDQMTEIWAQICSAESREDLAFVQDAFYDFSVMSETDRIQLMDSSDIDLLLVFGTEAGQWLAQNSEQLSYDYMVFGSADPVTAGIVPDGTGRFSDNSFAHVDPKRTGRQIDMAYRLFQFKNIGVVYEDSVAAYSYSGIRQLEECSQRYGFRIHTLHVEEPENENDYERYYRELKAAYAELIPQVEVLYITTGKIEDEKLPWLLEDVHEAGVITVAETQESQVEHGALVHITMSDPVDEGIFAGRTIAQYMEGTPIDQLNQVYEITPKIVFNYDTAKVLGVKIPMATYLIADTIYTKKSGEAGLEEFKK